MKSILKYFSNTYQVNLCAASITLFFVFWFSTGTLSPYALVAPLDLISIHCSTVSQNDLNIGTPNEAATKGIECLNQCRYIASIDHKHFLATFLMLDGAEKEKWGFSVVLRRVLFPMIAYPFMKVMGFELGGVTASFLIHFITFLCFIFFINKEIGEKAAILLAWTVATFPGIAYFGGLPYSYSFIFPGTLIIAILLWYVSKIENTRTILLLILGLGILSLGYDFLPIFGLTTLIILFRRKLYKLIVPSIIIMVLPTFFSNLLLKYYLGAEFLNANTAIYGFIGFSYLGIIQGFISSLFGIDPNSSIGIFLNKNAPSPDLNQWFEAIKPFPLYLIHNYLFSTFFYLPVLFFLLNLPRLFGKRLKLNGLELAILITVFLLFTFNNLAPPYRSWQIRGYEFDRIYEPLFIALMFYLGRKVQTLSEHSVIQQRVVWGLALIMILGNALTSFSMMLPNPIGLGIYVNFYRSGNTTEILNERIQKYGKYPLGFCAFVDEGKSFPKIEDK